MHESHLIEPVINGILQHAKREGAKSVLKVRLKVGLLTGVKEESFRQTFFLLSKGTSMENAELEITFFPGSAIQVISFDVG
jgi:Zn finger protein HypA/HybF involved in hydrogenase expression